MGLSSKPWAPSHPTLGLAHGGKSETVQRLLRRGVTYTFFQPFIVYVDSLLHWCKPGVTPLKPMELIQIHTSIQETLPLFYGQRTLRHPNLPSHISSEFGLPGIVESERASKLV